MTGSRFAVCVLSLIPLVTGAAPAPVTDLGGSSNISSSSTLTSPGGSSLDQRLAQSTQVQLQLMQQVRQLQSEMSELRGQLEVQNHQIQQLMDRQRDLYKELDRKTTAPALAVSGGAAVAATAATAAVPTPPADGNEQAAYEKAVQLVLQDKNYDKAIPAFEKFVKNYPASSYQPNARYWLGQLLLNKGNAAAAKACMPAEQYAALHQDDPDYLDSLQVWQALGDRFEAYTNAWNAVKAQ